MSVDQKRALVSQPSNLSITCQCALLGLSRSTQYYKAHKPPDETDWMNLIADIHGRRPSYGYRKVTERLRNQGYSINDKKVKRLMKQMGLRSTLPKPRTSIPNKESPVYPYLLKDLKITHANQVWAIDITYIRLPVGMVYLFALIDLHSRYIVGWKLAVTMETEHALEALRAALKWGVPEICNADQGAQFTSESWVACMESKGVQISHVGVGRCIDNIRIERFWWTLKHEDIYLSAYETVSEARAGIDEFIEYYNEERPHQALGYKTPFEMYFGRKSHQVATPQACVAKPSLKLPTGSTAHPLPFGFEGQGRAGAIDLWIT
jgi:putative transposase